jgi:tetratricopeptide (TPR) repeat protein
MLAEALLRSRKPREAIAPLQRAIALDPKRLELRLPMARALGEAGRAREAEDQYTKYLEAMPNDRATLAEYAVRLERRGDKTASLNLWQKVARITPDNALPHLQAGRLLHRLGRSEEALRKYRYVLQIAPGEPNALLGAAQLEEKTGQTARALPHWRALIAARPDYDAGYEALLRAAEAKGQLLATVNFLKQQLGKDPDRRVAYFAILRAYERSGDAEMGRKVVKDFIKRFPKSAAPRLALDSFDLQRARTRLRQLEKATPRPVATATPPATPAATPAATPPTESKLPQTPPAAKPETSSTPAMSISPLGDSTKPSTAVSSSSTQP